MSRYKLNNPFMTRIGQFDEGRSTLVVGVLESLLLTKKDDTLYVTMGKSPTVYYQTFAKLRNAPHTVWTNTSGRRVRIIPVREFLVKEETRRAKAPKKEKPAPKPKKKVELQLSLFA